MLIRLPWKDRKMISEVAKVYCNMAMRGGGYEDRIRQFWRISMYVKVWFLSSNDAKTILVAMEEFQRTYKVASSFKDPNGIFRGMEQSTDNLRALVMKREPKPEADL